MNECYPSPVANGFETQLLGSAFFFRPGAGSSGLFLLVSSSGITRYLTETRCCQKTGMNELVGIHAYLKIIGGIKLLDTMKSQCQEDYDLLDSKAH